MPLSFQSASHGSIAFGFFNIESDMLLLEHYFFFATDFCRHVVELSRSSGETVIRQKWPVRTIPERQQIGDLMGAIHDVRYTGFIGTVYRQFPFPQNPADFKQNPQGVDTRHEMAQLLEPFSKPVDLTVIADLETGEVIIGEYHFDITTFQQLIAYVGRGGYPRWKAENPPDYVRRMQKHVLASQSELFTGVSR